MSEPTDRAGLSAAGQESGPRDERTWLERFEMQLTIQRMSADDIAAAVADVRSYCVDSGQSLEEAFGDPRGYATTLAAETRPATPPSHPGARRVAVLMPAVLGLAVGFVSFTHRPEAPISLGQLLSVAVAIPAWAILTVPLAPARRRDPATPERPAFDEKGWRGLWLTLALVAVVVSLWTGLDQTLFTVWKWAPPVLGLVLLGVSQLVRWLWRPR